MTNNESKLDSLRDIDISKIAYTERVIQDIEKTCPDIRNILNGSNSNYDNIINKAAQSQINSMVESIKNIADSSTSKPFSNINFDLSKLQIEIPHIPDSLSNLSNIEFESTNPIAELTDASQKNIQTSKEIVAALHVLIETVGEIKKLNDVTKESNCRMEALNNRQECLTKGMLILAIGTVLFGFISVLTALYASAWGNLGSGIVFVISLAILIGLLFYLSVILYKIHRVNSEISKI